MQLHFNSRQQVAAARTLLTAPALTHLVSRGWLDVTVHPATSQASVDMSADHHALLSSGETVLLDLLASIAEGDLRCLLALDDPNRAAVAGAISELCGYAAVTVRGGVA